MIAAKIKVFKMICWIQMSSERTPQGSETAKKHKIQVDKLRLCLHDPARGRNKTGNISGLTENVSGLRHLRIIDRLILIVILIFRV